MLAGKLTLVRNEAQHWIHHGSRDIFGYSLVKMRHPPSWERWLGEAAFFCEPSADGKILAWRESGHARASYSAHPLVPRRRSSRRRGSAIDARQAHLARHPFCHSFQTRTTAFSARSSRRCSVAHSLGRSVACAHSLLRRGFTIVRLLSFACRQGARKCALLIGIPRDRHLPRDY